MYCFNAIESDVMKTKLFSKCTCYIIEHSIHVHALKYFLLFQIFINNRNHFLRENQCTNKEPIVEKTAVSQQCTPIFIKISNKIYTKL